MSLVGFSAKNHPQQTSRPDVDDRRTTRELFENLTTLYGPFTLDVAASVENAKCSLFFDEKIDGLAQSWVGHRVWCNPPYSKIRPWVEKASQEVRLGCLSVTMLLPANRCEQAWWQDLIEPNRDRRSGMSVSFLRGRHRFERPGWVKPTKGDRPPFGLVVVHWSGTPGNDGHRNDE